MKKMMIKEPPFLIKNWDREAKRTKKKKQGKEKKPNIFLRNARCSYQHSQHHPSHFLSFPLHEFHFLTFPCRGQHFIPIIGFFFLFCIHLPPPRFRTGSPQAAKKKRQERKKQCQNWLSVFKQHRRNGIHESRPRDGPFYHPSQPSTSCSCVAYREVP